MKRSRAALKINFSTKKFMKRGVAALKGKRLLKIQTLLGLNVLYESNELDEPKN